MTIFSLLGCLGGYHSTFPVRKDGITIAHACFFQSKIHTCSEDHRWEIHKGYLNLTECAEKVVVRVCTAPDSYECKEECQAEILKMEFLKEVLRKYPQFRDVFEICTVYKSEIDQLSKMACIFSSNQQNASIRKGVPVLIQHRVRGPFSDFFHASGEEDDLIRNSKTRPIFRELAIASYDVSGGTKVISGMRGVKQCHDTNGNNHTSRKYILTAITVDSVNRMFGSQDRGIEGIDALLRFLKSSSSGAIGDGRMITPSAPPLEEGQEATELDEVDYFNAPDNEWTCSCANRSNPLLHAATAGTFPSTNDCRHTISTSVQLFSMTQITGATHQRIALQHENCLTNEQSSDEFKPDLPPSYSSLFPSDQLPSMCTEVVRIAK